MAERLFFALWSDAAVRRDLAASMRAMGADRGRPTHPADLHLTLVFLGPLGEAQRRCAEGVAEALRAAPFGLRLERVGHWRGPRVLWCAPSEAPADLVTLVDALAGGLADHCGLTLERRPYRPHVTLARGIGRDPSAEQSIQPIDWPVSDFVLAGGSGGGPPRYRIHRRWPLGYDGSRSIVE
ncbi:2''-5'' RNA ligase [Thioflavicoccus mobilis 8321]|uniref:RNA 2',3'-cyclic phosphodiesterase n=1 Tax=Thioflavicoccus mobilis 8321 TaxID=765912 RepID=L0H0K3_9GAMM|nr:RNA 2',3'-cyclic phosphodiesterase [Thioflavicoccus mobilis]AGA91165.1 2''-5'' RNA ligase [Thioflavicoccus mobilis 8321]